MKLLSRFFKFLRKPFTVLSGFKKRFFRTPKSTIDRLSDDILSIILSQLDVNQRIRLELVCKRWKKVIEKLFENQETLLISDEMHFPIKQCYIQCNINSNNAKNFLFLMEYDQLIAQKIMEKFKNLRIICWVTNSLDTKLQLILNAILSNENHINLKSVNLFDTSRNEVDNSTKE
jgi:hypothetical protein